MQGSLDALRDIHLPGPVSWWPLAPGYWVLLILALVAAALWFQRYRRFRIHRAASAQLNALSAEWRDHQNAQQLAKAVNVLLRRVVLSLQPREEVASLTGDAWIERLQACTRNGDFEFNDATKNLLTQGIYQANVNADGDELIDVCRRWIAQLPAVSASGSAA